MERTKKAVAARIGRVCAHLSPSEFDALVSRIAEVEIKYALRRRDSLFDTSGYARRMEDPET